MWNRETDFGFERPTIGADVHEFVRVVLTGRRRNAETHTQRGPGRALHELLRSHRLAADEVRRQPQLEIAHARTRYGTCLFEYVARDITPYVGRHEHHAR